MAASDGARKQRAEWPPQPDRVFMALAAAWFETGEDGEEGAVLRWLEGLPPPAIAASEAEERTAFTSYVPVNDDGGGKKQNAKTAIDKLRNWGLAAVPEHRLRQPRGFPVAVPHDPAVHLIWSEALGGHREALSRLAAKVTHIGHSASFVQAWVEEGSGSDILATWAPTEGVAIRRLRVPAAGRLARLAGSCNRDSWVAYHDLREEIDRAVAERKAMKRPPRVGLAGLSGCRPAGGRAGD